MLKRSKVYLIKFKTVIPKDLRQVENLADHSGGDYVIGYHSVDFINRKINEVLGLMQCIHIYKNLKPADQNVDWSS